MAVKEKQVRIVGYLIVAVVFYTFFMVEMFFSWRDDNMWLKTISVTLILTLAIWEPIRFMVLQLRKKWPGIKLARIRIRLLLLFILPYTFLVGFLRIYIEHTANLWGVPIANFTNYSFTIGICLLFGLLQAAVYESLYYFAQWDQSKTAAEDLLRLNSQIQYDLLKVQIQPHFLFNTLNTLIGLMRIDTTRAISFTQELAYVYRYLLEANDRQLISLEEELKFTKAYFFLLKTRYSEGLIFTDFPDNAATELYSLPPLSLQLLLENAVKHNIITKDKPLNIHLEFNPGRKEVIMRNNLQMKFSQYNTGHGLTHLQKKFELLQLPAVLVEQNQTMFSVTIPLINTTK